MIFSRTKVLQDGCRVWTSASLHSLPISVWTGLDSCQLGLGDLKEV